MKALLLDAWRGAHGRSGSAFTAVSGLMIAMAACLIVALLAVALGEPDPAIADPERVVLLDMKGNPPGRPSPWFTASPVSFATMLKERGVPLDLISRTSGNGLDIDIDGRKQSAFLLIADPDLVPLLGLTTLQGDLRSALTQRDSIAITLELMHKLWGDISPAQAVGRRIDARGGIYTVTAVIPNPDPRTPLGKTNPMVGNAWALVGFESKANPMDEASLAAIFAIKGRVFARLRPQGSVDQVGSWMKEAFESNPLHAQLPAEWRTGREAAFFRAITLTQLPFEGAFNERRWRLLGAVAAASVLLLLMAAFNCMNLQTATLLHRQRETALRRSLGADGLQLIRLWSLEVLISLLLAAIGALLIAWWATPAIATWVGLSAEHPVADPLPLRFVLGLVIAVLALLALTLAAPASMALRQPPAPALQGRTASEGPWGRRVRQVLLAIQLSGVVLLIALAGVLTQQQRYLLSIDRGFETHNRLWLGVMVDPEAVPSMHAFTAALDRHPAVKAWAFSNARPADETRGPNELHVSSSQHKQVLRVTTVSPSFFTTYGMTVLAGTPTLASGETHMVIDEKASRLLGFPNPQAAIGELLRGGGGFLQEGSDTRRVVAVVQSVKLESARDPALPQAFLLSDKPQWDLTVHGDDMTMLRQTLDDLWKAYGPRLVYDIQSVDDQLASVYQQEQQLTTMLTAVALLAIGVAMLGAYALIADTVRRRRTELVLRRLHGADDVAIVRQLSREFIPPLLVAAAIGLPLAAALGERYLAAFVDRVDARIGLVLPMVLAGAATLFVTALAALRHVRRALAIQPIEALK
ncbi:FtsX-like permease family protein [Steroidobacter cummioxidans]|uniref:FtsX-like permease family protein n=1 Tax=Steroidobacter cummioxidans TaxID=1803913 RepID=UPI000E3196C5|nr:FtsX-like permease family protein [Steroidobacter cummioxidans]